jgi:hypothetical protein
MNRFESVTAGTASHATWLPNDGNQVAGYKPLRWLMALLLVAFVAGCGNGGGGRDPILGGGGKSPAPTVTAVTPANIATAVPINIKIITAAFSEAMNATTLNTASFLLECPAGTPVIGGGAVTYLSAGNVATLPLPAATNLPPSAVCKATVTTAAKDTTGLPLASNFVWTFTTGATPDTTRPRVVLTVPATTTPGPTLNVPANSAITAVFTEDMAPATLASPATSFTLTCAGTPVTSPAACVTASPAGTVNYLASRMATFNLPAGTVLEAGKTYTATIKGTGASPATDVASNALAGITASPTLANDYVWTFVAAAPDIIPPTITLENPADIATGVAINSSINATFSEAMDLSTAVFTVQPSGPPLGTLVLGTWAYDPVSNIATFKPTIALASSTQYTATITGAKDLAGNALVTTGVGAKPDPWTFTTGTGLAPGAVPLGVAGTYGIMATGSTVSTGASLVNGDVALHPGTSQGIPVLQVTGTINVNNPAATAAQTALTAAYNFAWGRATDFTMTPGADQGASFPFTGPLVGGTGGMAPGVYESPSTMLINTPLTLNAGGNVDAVWIFKIGSSLTTFTGTPGGDVLLANGAQAKNVFFVPFAAATIGVGTTFNGTILAGGDVTGQTGATINGRLLAGESGAGVLTLDSTTVNVPAP